MDEVRAKKLLLEITIAKSPLDYITGKKSKRGRGAKGMEQISSR